MTHGENQQNDHMCSRYVNEAAPLVRASSDRQMTYGLCCCFEDTDVCCNVMWCSPCLLGYTYDAIVNDQPHSMNVGVCVGVSLAYLLGSFGAAYVNLVLGLAPFGNAACVLGCLPCTMSVCQQRGEVREKLGLQDNMCEDFILSCFCPACVQCQITREAKGLRLHPCSVCCEDADETPGVVHTVPQGVVVQPGYANNAR